MYSAQNYIEKLIFIVSKFKKKENESYVYVDDVTYLDQGGKIANVFFKRRSNIFPREVLNPNLKYSYLTILTGTLLVKESSFTNKVPVR